MQKHFNLSKKLTLFLILLSVVLFLPKMGAEANSSSQNDHTNNIYLPIVSNNTDDASQMSVTSANRQATSPTELVEQVDRVAPISKATLEARATPVIKVTPIPENTPEPTRTNIKVTHQEIMFVADSNRISTGKSEIENCLERINLVEDVKYVSNIWLSSIRKRVFLYSTSRDTNAESIATELKEATSSEANRVTARRCRKIQAAQPNFTYKVNQWINGGSMMDVAVLPIDGFTPPQMMATQPALNDLVAGSLNSLEGFSGKGIRVAILDTVPVNAFNGSTLPMAGAPNWEIAINTAKMNNPYITIHDTPCGRPPGLSQQHAELIQEHGVYVASLVHAVAPEARIELYRVLNHCGLGTAMTLIQVLDQFIASNGKQPAVINMSFGAKLPNGLFLTEENLESEFTIIWNLIKEAKANGIALVAASGNGSAYVTAPKPAEWPAAFPDVLSVAASDGLRDMSCFSNQGDILAPGGNSQENWVFVPNAGFDFDELTINGNGAITPGITVLDGTFQTAGCEPRMEECLDNPEMCIIGQNSQQGLSYLKGTSFAAPMVAGIAALAREAYPNMSVDELFTGIKSSAMPASQNPDLLIAQKNIQ